MQLGKTFNRNEMAEPDNNFDPIPAGWYQAEIEKAEVKQTKAGTGSYLNVQYRITGEQYHNRVVFGMITISNPNQIAEQIGEKDLGSLMDSCGLVSVSDTDQFIGKTVIIEVKVKAATDQYEASNTVSGWKPAGKAPSAPRPAFSAPQAPAAPEEHVPGAPAWATK